MTTPAQPLAGQEWVDTVFRIEDLWPGTKSWSKADALFEVFRSYPRDLIDAAVNHLFAEGRQTAPSPSALMGTLRRLAAERGIRGDESSPCQHPHQAHIRPSDQGGEPRLTGTPGPGRVECAGCRVALGECHCPGCARDPLYRRRVA